MTKCSYKDVYKELEGGEFIYFECKEESLQGREFCKFHDGTHILNNANADYIKEEIETKIRSSIFTEKPLYFIGYNIPSNITIKGKFESVYFINSTFYGRADFSGATFNGRADFSATNFNGHTIFRNAKFIDKANFAKAKFVDDVDFCGSEFSAETLFNSVEFLGKTIFSNVNFNNSKVLVDISFSETDFHKKVIFTYTQFGSADFRASRFYDIVSLIQSTFNGDADFRYTEFHARANFNFTIFCQSAIFSYSRFIGKAYFKESTISGTADFRWAQFSSGGDISFKPFIGDALFNYVIFEQSDNTLFVTKNASNISFINTDISKIKFGEDVIWGEGKNEKFKVLEERKLDKKMENRNELEDENLGSIKAIYRNLRENYEYRLRYDEAGKFFIREMELKRKYRQNENKIIKNGKLRRHLSLVGLYYHLSRYGEELTRPAIIGLIIVFMSTLLWVTQNNPTLHPSFSNNSFSSICSTLTPTNNESLNTISKFVGFDCALSIEHWIKSFIRTISDFIPLLQTPSEFKIGLFDYIIKIFGGALTFGFILIALRRKFERKFRH